MVLILINGLNAIPRSIISKLVGKRYQKVKLLDFRPYRQSVYTLQRQLASQGVELEKQMVQNAAALEHGIEGGSDVLYFTHDYCANAADKNSFIQGTAKIAKKHGIKKFVAVAPVENELFYTEDAKQPLEKQAEAQTNALQSNPNMTILNSDLVYGKGSHLLHYIAQCVEAGRIYHNIGAANSYKFKPISDEDLAKAVEHSLTNFNDVKGKNYIVQGNDEATLKDLLNTIESALGRGQGTTKLSKSFLRQDFSDYFEEFFVGITHDKNFRRLAEYFEQHKPDLTVGRENYHKAHNLSLSSKGVKDTYQTIRYREEDLIFPTFANYKMTSLD